jgi:hypothetical protein
MPTLFRRTLGWAGVAAFFATAAQAQRFEINPLEGAFPVSGVRVNALGVYAGGFELTSPTGPGVNFTPGRILAFGSSADLGYYQSGRGARVLADYHLGYNGNNVYPALRGTDQSFRLGLRIPLTPKVNLSLSGSGRSAILGSYLYSASMFSPARSAADPGRLSAGFSGAGVASELLDSPVGLAFMGGRIRSGAASVELSFSQSSRLVWHATARVTRDMPAQSASVEIFPGITWGQAGAGFSYSLSRRTSIGVDLEYSRSYITAAPVQLGFVSFNARHLLTRKWFVNAQGAGGAWSSPSAGQTGSVRPGYRAAGGVGMNAGSHTLLISGQRSISNWYGLLYNTSTSGFFSWSVGRRGSPWDWGSSAGYEQLTSSSQTPIAGWFTRVRIGRQIGGNLGWQVEGVYTGGTIANVNVLNGPSARKGVRISLLWTPPVRLLEEEAR